MKQAEMAHIKTTIHFFMFCPYCEEKDVVYYQIEGYAKDEKLKRKCPNCKKTYLIPVVKLDKKNKAKATTNAPITRKKNK